MCVCVCMFFLDSIANAVMAGEITQVLSLYCNVGAGDELPRLNPIFTDCDSDSIVRPGRRAREEHVRHIVEDVAQAESDSDDDTEFDDVSVNDSESEKSRAENDRDETSEDENDSGENMEENTREIQSITMMP